MGWFLDQKASLRSRMLFAIGVMLLPLCVLALITFIAVRGAVSTLEKAVYDPVEKQIFVTDIQKLFYQIKIPIQQFGNRSEEGDHTQFDSLAVQLGLGFDNGFANIDLSKEEFDLLTTAKHEFINLQAIANQLFVQFHLLNADQRQRLVLDFSRGVDRCLAMMARMENIALNEIQSQRLAAQEIKWKSVVLVIIILGCGLVFAILGAVVLFRSVMAPIRNLEHTVNRFGQGDLSSRINYNANDELGHLASAFNAMAERFQKIQTELDYLSIHDSLTGLFDRPQFHDVVGMEVHRAKRYDRPFSVLFFDINEFRAVNESYGHLVGDSVLCSVAMQISGAIRPTDTAARYGGDEFAVVLSETDAQGAQETAARIAKAIADHPLNIGDGKSLTIQVSVGIATFPIDADNDTGLFAQAEYALERAKRQSQKQELPKLSRGD
ncbi:MAG: diguanylate cyclase [Gammaproteobacteria bacterium]|nr:diguanylate cyclase [Gammaproteobacteria bacterium]